MSGPPALSKARPYQRIADVLAILAIAAALRYLAIDLPRLGGERLFPMLLVACFCGFVVYGASRLVVSLLTCGTTCPRCGMGDVHRVAVISFGPRYYRCGACQARLKRDAGGALLPAKGPEDALAFLPATAVSPPGLEPVADPVADAEHGWRSLDALVSNQRHRQQPDG